MRVCRQEFCKSRSDSMRGDGGCIEVAGNGARPEYGEAVVGTKDGTESAAQKYALGSSESDRSVRVGSEALG